MVLQSVGEMPPDFFGGHTKQPMIEERFFRRVQSLENWLDPLIRGVGGLVFEPICQGCGELLDVDRSGDQQASEAIWCRKCLLDLFSNLASVCTRCSADLPSCRPAEGKCLLCRKFDFRFDRAVSVGNYHRTMRELIVRMKGRHDESLAWQLGKLLAIRVQEIWKDDHFDVIVPVPTWWVRRLQRGFVGPEIIADAVGTECGVRISTGQLRCCRKTAKQGTLNTPARFRNVAGMFEVSTLGCFAGQRVLLVDDVMTSGATVSQAAGILRRMGRADSVDVAVIARGSRGV
jgi:ComF family protein